MTEPLMEHEIERVRLLLGANAKEFAETAEKRDKIAWSEAYDLIQNVIEGMTFELSEGSCVPPLQQKLAEWLQNKYWFRPNTNLEEGEEDV